LQVFDAGVLITGVTAAFCGIIGCVGQISLHIGPLEIGGNNARVMPFSALFGAIVLIWADIAALVGYSPEDIPIRVGTGLIGGMFFDGRRMQPRLANAMADHL
jgi:iron complex transport system permease protein